MKLPRKLALVHSLLLQGKFCIKKLNLVPVVIFFLLLDCFASLFNEYLLAMPGLQSWGKVSERKQRCFIIIVFSDFHDCSNLSRLSLLGIFLA